MKTDNRVNFDKGKELISVCYKQYFLREKINSQIKDKLDEHYPESVSSVSLVKNFVS